MRQADSLDRLKMPLLRTPQPFKGESLWSLVLRAAEANGHESMRSLLTATGYDSRIFTNRASLDRLAAALSCEIEVIESMRLSPYWHGRTNRVSLAGHSIPRAAIETTICRICPLCLGECRFIPQIWSLKTIVACQLHGTYLVHQCSRCGKPLTWLRQSLDQCNCGQSLPDIKAPLAERASLALAAIQCSRVGGSDQSATSEIAQGFAALDLGDLVDQLLLLGAYANGRGSGAGLHVTARISGDAAIEAFGRVAAILCDWPNSLFVLLDQIRKTQPSSSRESSGIEAEFASFYAALYSRRRTVSPGVSAIRAAFEQYLLRYWDGGFLGPKNRRLDGHAVGEAQYFPLAEAARRIGAHPKVLQRAIEASAIRVAQRRAGKRTVTIIKSEELERFRSMREAQVGLQSARRLLGIGEEVILDLVRASILPCSSGPEINGARVWGFQKEDLECFVARIMRGVPIARNPAEFTSLYGALRRASFFRLSAADLFRSILELNLSVRGLDSSLNGLEQLLFDSVEFEAFLRAGRTSIDWAIPIPEAAKRLRIKDEVAYHLVRRGILPCTNVNVDGRVRRLISLEAIDSFSKAFVRAEEMAVRQETSSRSVVEHLGSIGIVPVTGPTVDGGRQYFFAAKDVENWNIGRSA